MNRQAKAAAAVAPAAALAASLLRRHKKHDPEQVLRAYYDAWAKGDAEAVGELVADDYCGHVHTLSGTEEQSAEELAERVEGHAGAFEQVEYDVEDVIASDGRVAARVTMRAGHRETGREAETVGLVILRVEDGRIAEEWSSWDYLGLAERLGLAK
jgi:steroid delta-isomerase-like uncharacterized protein